MSGNGELKLGPDTIKAQQGNVEIALGHEHGKVVMQFFRPIPEIRFDPANAVQLAEQMIELAVVLGVRVEIPQPKRKITREQRDRLVNRAAHVFRSLQEKGKPPAYVAKHVVDTILSAIE